MFTASLLAEQTDAIDIIGILCTIVRDHLEPAKRTSPGFVLANETVGLLEGLCWNAKDDSVGR